MRMFAAAATLFFSLSTTIHAQDVQAQLIEAAMRGDADELKTLLAAGAKADDRDSDRRTALAYAAAQGSLPAVQALLDAGASAETKDQEGVSPLMIASAGGAVLVWTGLSLALRRFLGRNRS